MSPLKLEDERTVDFTLLTGVQQFEKSFNGKSYTRYKVVVKHDGKMKILEFGISIARQFSNCIMSGFSPKGEYRLVTSGIGLNRRYEVTPLHEKHVPKLTWKDKFRNWKDKLLNWKDKLLNWFSIDLMK